MKRKVLLLLTMIAVMGSCSSDSADDPTNDETNNTENTTGDGTTDDGTTDDGTTDDGTTDDGTTDDGTTDDGTTDDGTTDDGTTDDGTTDDGTTDDGTTDDGTTDDGTTDDGTTDDGTTGDGTTDDGTTDDGTTDDGTTDDGTTDDGTATTPVIMGVWHLSTLRVNDETKPLLPSIKNAVDALVEDGCVLASFNFIEDMVLETEDKITSVDAQAAVLGAAVSCPDESRVASSTWSLDGMELTLVEDGVERTFTIALEDDDNTLIVPGVEINSDFLTGSDAVFERVQ